MSSSYKVTRELANYTINPGDNEVLSRNDLFAKSIFAARLPIPSYKEILKDQYRSAQVVKLQSTGADAAMLTDPYSNYIKAHIEDAYRKDYTIRRGIDLYVKFLLGKRTNTVLDVNREFMNIDLQEQVIADTFNEDEVNKTKTMIDRINRKVRFHSAIFSATTQALLAGRSAVTVETGAEGLPESLKILNWRKLGRVYADPETWQFIGVEYADRPKEAPLRANEILYFPHADYHISPNTLWYGLSKIEPLLDVSHTNRIINQEDLKEGVRIAWAKNGLVEFMPNTPLAKMKEFINNFRPGWHGTTQQVKIQVHDINVDLPGIANIRETNDRVLTRGLTLPAFVMGYEEIPNRATAEAVLHGWRESELNYSRTWLQDLLESQWFDSLLKIRYPDLDLSKMWIKAKLEFEDITFESLKDRVEALLPLVQAGYIPIEKALKMWDMDDVIPQIQAQKREMDRIRKEELEMMRLEREEREDRERNRANTRDEDRTDRPDEGEEEDGEEDDDEEDERPRRRTRQGAIMNVPDGHGGTLKLPVIATHELEHQPTPPSQEDQKLKEVIEQMKKTNEEIKEAANLRQASVQEEQLKMARDEHEYKMQMLRRINEKLENLSSTT